MSQSEKRCEGRTHCLHPYMGQHDSAFWHCCRAGCSDLFVVHPPLLVEEKTHGMVNPPRIVHMHVRGKPIWDSDDWPPP